MIDLEKEILHELCTLLKPFDIIIQVITISMFSYNFFNTFYLRIIIFHRVCSGMRLVVLSSYHGTRTLSRIFS